MKNANSSADILKKAREAKTSDDFSAVIAKLEQMIGDLGNRRHAIEAEREAAVFGEGDLAKIRRSSIDAEEELETLQAALAGAKRRRNEAMTRERKESDERTGLAVKAKAEEYRQVLVAYSKAIAEARATHASMDRLRRELDSMNEILEGRGRRELCVPSLQISRPFVADKPMPMADLSRNGRAIDETLRSLLGPSIAPRMGTTVHGFVPTQHANRSATAA